MIIELLANLRTDDGLIKAGTYDSSKREFPPSLQREIEIHRERGRRVLRIIKEDAPAPSTKKKSPSKKTKASGTSRVTTVDDESTFTNTEEDEKQRRKRK